MLTDIVITIHCVHGYDMDNPELIEFSTDGYYKNEDGVQCFTYMETEVTGMEGTQTSILIMPDSVVVDRDGSISSRMVFKEGEKCSFLFKTPYGNATMGIMTKRITNNLDDGNGNMEIDYVMDMDHTVASKNKLILEVKHA